MADRPPQPSVTVRYVPMTVLGNTTAPPRWQPCAGCGGSGGSMHYVNWSLHPVWIACGVCGGGAGSFVP